MSTPLDCPGIECWQVLLDVTLPPEQRERFERHLESCPVCQQRIDQSEDSQISLRRLGRLFGDPTVAPTDPTLEQVRERLHERISSTSATPADLYYLSPSDRPDLLGTLGDYEVQEVIGQGGMGIVLKAFDPALHRLVAIKVLSPALAGSGTARRRFTREAQAAAAVCHDHIVPVHGVHETAGLPYLVMQYVAGESLQARLDRIGPFAVTEIVRIGLQTASGLAAAHALGLIHRDVKPANLLLEGEPVPSGAGGRIKITDFGLARMLDDAPLTQSGVVAGTPGYVAPEQARGDPLDHRADLFSLGSVLYALCTGVPPFRGGTAVAVLRKVGEQDPAPVRSLNPDIPAWLETLVGRLMAKDPADRFQSAAEVAQLLEGYLAHLRQPVTISVPILPPAPTGVPSRRRPGGMVLLGSLLLGALGLATVFGLLAQLTSDPSAPEDFYQDFRGGHNPVPPLKLIDADTDAVTRAEDQGFRITLPALRKSRAPVGVSLQLSLVGDFEITASYELLAAQLPTTGAGVAVALNLAVNRPYKFAKLGRFVRAEEGNVYLAENFLKGPPPHNKIQTVPTESQRGQLRLVRKGSMLHYLVADAPGNAFREVLREEFGTDNIEIVRFIVNNNDSPAAVDAHLVDLRIRGGGVSGGQTDASPGERPLRSHGWLTASLFAGLAGMIASAVGVWLYRRRQRPGPFSCPNCGRGLKVKAELAGKKVKCPQCGAAVGVLPSEPDKPSRSAARGWQAAAAVGVFLLMAGGIAWWTHRPPPPVPSFSALFDQTIGTVPVEGIEESGFHDPESSPGFPKWRWTDGNAKLVVPLQGSSPKALYVRLAIPALRPRLHIRVNGQTLFDEKVTEDQWTQIFDLAAINVGPTLTLEIHSDTFVPAKRSQNSNDQRVLGVRVLDIAVISGTKSYTDVPLGVLPVLEVTESGFHLAQLDGGEMTRWTNGSARLTVPIRGPAPRALALILGNTDLPDYRVRVTVNGIKLFDDAVKQNILAIELPLKGVDLGQSAHIELDSSTVVPAEVAPGSTDRRKLGVRVKRLMLISDVGGEKR